VVLAMLYKLFFSAPRAQFYSALKIDRNPPGPKGRAQELLRRRAATHRLRPHRLQREGRQ